MDDREMPIQSSVEIVDVTKDPKYERFLYWCIFHTKKEFIGKSIHKTYKHRYEYLKTMIPKGFRKKVLFYKGDHVGMIEYAPVEASGFPIIGENVIVMNCIWVHKRAAGHHFGKLLIEHMMEDKKGTTGFATLGCEGFHRVYVKKDDMEKLGFYSLKSMKVKHKGKKKGGCFTIHLMWMPVVKNAKLPTWNESKLMEGLYFCEHHPLYHGKHGCAELRFILEKH
ncbi:unnamed protein product [marine sediment metagenome]|uniref:N-acetyltransferase domain-containing protein n=1 Tax=marine sediment metagenome TaxID=412755 RepID=X1HBE2_9ZZZZ